MREIINREVAGVDVERLCMKGRRERGGEGVKERMGKERGGGLK